MHKQESLADHPPRPRTTLSLLRPPGLSRPWGHRLCHTEHQPLPGASRPSPPSRPSFTVFVVLVFALEGTSPTRSLSCRHGHASCPGTWQEMTSVTALRLSISWGM